MIQNDICESCGNRLKTNICKDCRYATESYYEPIEMNFSEAYKKFSEGKTIYRGHGFWNNHNCDDKVFTSQDFLADDWTVFDDEKIFIKKSDYRALEVKQKELNILKSHIGELIRNEIPELKSRSDAFICCLISEYSSLKEIKKESKRI